ncbi:peptide chain release factor 2 [bacterium]|nr:peptide chain release factor 2 [bacterium]
MSAILPEDLSTELDRVRERVDEAKQYLKLDDLRRQIVEAEQRAAAPGFWDDAAKAQEHMRQLNRLKGQVGPWDALGQEVADAIELAEMADDDEEMTRQLCEQAAELAHKLESLETRALMKEAADAGDCYLHIHAGAGGTESCDWAQMLLRMYTRWVERSGLTFEEIELSEGEEAGIRSATLLVKGEYAYGQLKSESGIHRLVRISPFDANKRRHTSFCSIYCWPQVDDNVEIEIKEEDLKIDVYRSSGAGGQHVNKTSSAVRITHLPTKLVVQCQNERSQHQNKAQAMKMLRSRLYQLHEEQKKAEMAVKESQKSDISWGNQIRSYVFQPYQMVKDHRTGYETGNIPVVMDGDLDGFIEAYLRWTAGMPVPGAKSPGPAAGDID